MPYVSFAQNEFIPWKNPAGENAPVAQKTVQLSGRQKKLRITGAASMLSYVQSSNDFSTMAPFNIKYGDPASQEKYFLDTRSKDTFDVTIPFKSKNQISFFVVWKGSYTWYQVEQVFGFGLFTPMEISIHEIMEGDE